MKGVSIIICCFNSAERIEDTLTHVSTQLISTLPSAELIIVDNDSRDNTQDVVKAKWKILDSPMPLTVIKEERKGLKYAREKGISVARHDYLIFVDDDNWLSSNYMELAFQTLEQHPALSMVGGHGQPVSDIAIPDWFEEVKAMYAVGAQSSTPILPMNSGYIYGAGMVFRRTDFEQLLKFEFPFYSEDRKGNALTGGHDVELSWAFRLLGKSVGYNENMRFDHFIGKEKLTLDYAQRLASGSGKNFVPFSFFALMNFGPVSNLKFSFLLLKRIVSAFADCALIYTSKRGQGKKIDLEFRSTRTTGFYLLFHFFRTIRYFQNLKEFRLSAGIDHNL